MRKHAEEQNDLNRINDLETLKIALERVDIQLDSR